MIQGLPGSSRVAAFSAPVCRHVVFVRAGAWTNQVAIHARRAPADHLTHADHTASHTALKHVPTCRPPASTPRFSPAFFVWELICLVHALAEVQFVHHPSTGIFVFRRLPFSVPRKPAPGFAAFTGSKSRRWILRSYDFGDHLVCVRRRRMSACQIRSRLYKISASAAMLHSAFRPAVINFAVRFFHIALAARWMIIILQA